MAHSDESGHHLLGSCRISVGRVMWEKAEQAVEPARAKAKRHEGE